MQTFENMPARVDALPRDGRGFPVPWFVAWLDDKGEPCESGKGTPDFRVIGPDKVGTAIRQNRCWVCGGVMGVRKAFVIGPMCAINMVTAEPGNHLDCAIFSATACPFLSRPRMRRNENDMPECGRPAPGLHIKRNPGAACIWITKTFRLFRPHAGEPGFLISLGPPENVLWFANGRTATRAEVLASIDSGYPQLQELAQSEGPSAVDALQRQRAATEALLPAA